MKASVAAVCAKAGHSFSKDVRESITLLEGLGVEGDGHLGTTVQHLSRIAKDPSQPNLRQVHLLHEEVFAELSPRYVLSAGMIGENVLTRGLALLDLPVGTKLHLGAEAVVELTGLRNPCRQLNDFRPGLMHAMLDRAEDGALIRKAGVMSVVLKGGVVRPGDTVEIESPAEPHKAMEPV